MEQTLDQRHQTQQTRTVPPLRRHHRSPLGAHTTWVMHGTLVGLAVSWVSTPTLLPFSLLSPPPLAMLALGALHGAVLGALGRAFLNEFRGRLSLPTLALLVPVLAGVVSGLLSLWSSLLLHGLHPGLLLFDASLSAVLVGLAWLPYAMATVMGWSRWPVFVGTVLLTPPATVLAAWNAAVLLRLIGG